MDNTLIISLGLAGAVYFAYHEIAYRRSLKREVKNQQAGVRAPEGERVVKALTREARAVHWDDLALLRYAEGDVMGGDSAAEMAAMARSGI